MNDIPRPSELNGLSDYDVARLATPDSNDTPRRRVGRPPRCLGPPHRRGSCHPMRCRSTAQRSSTPPLLLSVEASSDPPH
jgi:hypothetical protein